MTVPNLKSITTVILMLAYVSLVLVLVNNKVSRRMLKRSRHKGQHRTFYKDLSDGNLSLKKISFFGQQKKIKGASSSCSLLWFAGMPSKNHNSVMDQELSSYITDITHWKQAISGWTASGKGAKMQITYDIAHGEGDQRFAVNYLVLTTVRGNGNEWIDSVLQVDISVLQQRTNSVPIQASSGDNQLVYNNTLRIDAYKYDKFSDTATTRLKLPIQATEEDTVVVNLKLVSGQTFVIKEIGLCTNSSRQESLQ